MNKYCPSAILLLTVFLTLARAEETAVVTDNKVNVRGGPSFVREVVTQVQKGDKVTVLDHVTTEKPKPGEPTNWAKIKLPANTPVWVFAPFLKEHKVSVSKLNLRGGPGENYSVLGRLMKDAEVKEVRTVEEWMQVETPEQAYGFVDAKYLKPAEDDTTGGKPVDAVAGATVVAAAAETASEKKPEKTPEQPKPEESKPVPPPAKEEPKEEKPAPVETVKQPEPVAETKEAKPAPVVPPPIVPPPTTPEATPKLPVVAPAPEPPPADAPLPKRIVRREGVVKGTISVQAPTYYELVNVETKKVMNYLHTEDLDIHFKKFSGKRVVVSGEEGMDPRWPNTPVIEVDTIETAP